MALTPAYYLKFLHPIPEFNTSLPDMTSCNEALKSKPRQHMHLQKTVEWAPNSNYGSKWKIEHVQNSWLTLQVAENQTGTLVHLRLQIAYYQTIGGYCLACCRTLLLYSAGSYKCHIELFSILAHYNTISNQRSNLKHEKHLHIHLIALSLCWISRVWLIEQILDAN